MKTTNSINNMSNFQTPLSVSKSFSLSLGLIGLLSCILILASIPSNAQWTTSGTTTVQSNASNDLLLGGSSLNGMGVKCFWDNSKKAFRGGELGFLGDGYWDADSIGNHSFSYGINTKAKGNASVSFGQRTEANGDFSIAMGNQSKATNVYSIAMGNGATSSAFASIAIGSNANSTWSNAIAIGQNTKAHHLFTLALGDGTEALANSAVAVGKDAIANGSSSLALGNNAIATGGQSIAIGRNVESATGGAITIGAGTISANLVNSTANSMAFGVNSTIPTLTITNSLGAGLTGKVGIGTTSPSSKLHVNGDATISGNANFLSDVVVTGQIVHPSDARLKTNITKVENALSQLNQIEVVNYNYKDEFIQSQGLSSTNQTGLLAQNVLKVYPHLVKENTLTDEQGNVYAGVNYEQLVPHLIKAIQELNVEIEKLKNQ